MILYIRKPFYMTFSMIKLFFRYSFHRYFLSNSHGFYRVSVFRCFIFLQTKNRLANGLVPFFAVDTNAISENNLITILI